MQDKDQISERLKQLREEHKEFETKLSALMRETMPNHLEIQRVKKKKLELKDQIRLLKNQLTPDIIA